LLLLKKNGRGKTMARPGGNPELVKYQFQNKGEAPLNKKLSINFTEEMHDEIKRRGGSEFIRLAVAKAISESSDTQSA
jgi:hypothetical protein